MPESGETQPPPMDIEFRVKIPNQNGDFNYVGVWPPMSTREFNLVLLEEMQRAFLEGFKEAYHE